MGWNGTRMKTSWLKLRGNASGRTLDRRFVKFFCDGCRREHGRYVTRTLTLDGKTLCDRQYYKQASTTAAKNVATPAAIVGTPRGDSGVTAGETAN